jgi:hypothetical protein
MGKGWTLAALQYMRSCLRARAARRTRAGCAPCRRQSAVRLLVDAWVGLQRALHSQRCKVLVCHVEHPATTTITP